MSADFTPADLRQLEHLVEKVANNVAWIGKRLVVEVWDETDEQPVAWVEMHPDDSAPTVTFEPRFRTETNTSP